MLPSFSPSFAPYSKKATAQPSTSPIPSMNMYRPQTLPPSRSQVPITLTNDDDSLSSISEVPSHTMSNIPSLHISTSTSSETMDVTMTLTGVNTTEAEALTPALTNTTEVFFQDSFADEDDVTVTDVEITVDSVRYLSDSKNAPTYIQIRANEDKVDMNLKLYLEKSNAITFEEMKSIVENIVQSSIVELISEIQRSVSSDITGIEMIFVSDSSRILPSITPTETPSTIPTHTPSVSTRPSTTPSEVPSAGKTVVTAQTLAAVGGAAAAAASSDIVI